MAAKKKSKVTKVTYRVDQILPTGAYGSYTSKHGVARAFADSLAGHLKRNGTGGRLVELPSGAVVEEWEHKNALKPDANRDAIQALRDKFQS